MIYTSPVDGLNQSSPVTTTYDPNGHQLDVQGLYAFCIARAFERVAAAAVRHDRASLTEHWRGLRVLDVMYADAKRHPNHTAGVSLSLRVIAVRDRGHEAFHEQWAFSE